MIRLCLIVFHRGMASLILDPESARRRNRGTSFVIAPLEGSAFVFLFGPSNAADVLCIAISPWQRNASASKCFRCSFGSFLNSIADRCSAVNSGTSVHLIDGWCATLELPWNIFADHSRLTKRSKSRRRQRRQRRPGPKEIELPSLPPAGCLERQRSLSSALSLSLSLSARSPGLFGRSSGISLTDDLMI